MVLILLVSTGGMSVQAAGAAPKKRKKTASTHVAPKLEDLPQRPVDTLQTSDPQTKVIIFSNNTWSYYRPGLAAEMKNLKVYREHWDTTQVFAYRTIELASLPSVVELKLFDDLSRFHTPIQGKVFSKYGPRGRRNHNGVDVPLKTGEPIYAAFDGRVRYSKYNTGGFGNLVILRHPNGLETWHAHLTKRNVEAGEYVKSGQVIGFGGNTGRSRGPHLHFETRYCDQTFDPERLFDFETGQIRYQTFALDKRYFNIHSRASDQLEEDDVLEGFSLIAAESDDSTSVDILERIAQAQQKDEEKQQQARAAVAKGATVGPNNAVYHTIRSGDMLGKIAMKYGVSVNQICRLNGITTKTKLQIGKRLRIK